jgi:transposase InsO family protein
MCQILQVSRSGYYAWKTRKFSDRDDPDQEWIERIRLSFYRHKGRYGSPRITDELHDYGWIINEKKVARLMKKADLSAKMEQKYRIVTTNSSHDYPISPNLLDQKFDVSFQDEVWLSDITYIRLGTGWVFLAVILDLFNREVIGWSLSDSMSSNVVIEALENAMFRRGSPANVIFHSDRGIQYASRSFRDRLKDYNCIQSMSRKGNCWDNAPMESFFRTFKTELIYREEYRSYSELKRITFDYIERYYNNLRKHSSLGYKTPAQFRVTFAA